MSKLQLKPGLTVIVPVYNEIDSLPDLERALLDYSMQADMPFEVLFVDDGSTDGSLDRIKTICTGCDQFHFISFDKNQGLSAALKVGFDKVQSDWVGYMDADLQTTPEDFNLLWSLRNEADFITGIRMTRNDSMIKRFSSWFGNGFRRLFTKDGILDSGCPMKVMRTSFAKKIPMFSGLHRFLPAMIMLQNGRIKQVEVRHFPRAHGKSKFHFGNRFLSPFVDCLVYLWMKRRYINYTIKQKG